MHSQGCANVTTISRTSPSPQKETSCPLSSHSSFPSELQLLAVTNLFVFMNLPFLDITCKRSNIRVAVHVYLPQLSIIFSKFIHAVAYYQYFIPFHGWVIFHCMDITTFVYLFIYLWILVSYHFLAIMNNASCYSVFFSIVHV